MYEIMISVATFDVLPTDDLFGILFSDLSDDENPFSDKFDRLEIGSRFMVMNMGTMFLVLCFYGCLLIILPCCVFVKNDAKCAARNEPKIRRMLFFTHIILFLQEGYLDILLAGTINIFFIRNGDLEWNSASLFLTNLLSIVMVVSCGVLFLFMTCYLWPRFD